MTFASSYSCLHLIHPLWRTTTQQHHLHQLTDDLGQRIHPPVYALRQCHLRYDPHQLLMPSLNVVHSLTIDHHHHHHHYCYYYQGEGTYQSFVVSRILGPKLLRQLGQWSEVWNVFSSDATVWSFVALIMDSRQERQQLNWQYCEEHWMGWDVSYGTRVESERHRRHSSSSSFSSSNTFSLSLS